MAMTYQEMIAQAKAEITEIDPAALERRLGEGTAIIDCREADEFEQGAIRGARLIPRGLLESNIAMQIPNRSTPIAIYCAAGARSALAAKVLKDMGYTDVVSNKKQNQNKNNNNYMKLIMEKLENTYNILCEKYRNTEQINLKNQMKNESENPNYLLFLKNKIKKSHKSQGLFCLNKYQKCIVCYIVIQRLLYKFKLNDKMPQVIMDLLQSYWDSLVYICVCVCVCVFVFLFVCVCLCL